MDILKDLPDSCVDLVLCDLPYEITSCKWDVMIPLEPLWEQYKRITRDRAAIVLTASQPFTSILVMSNLKMYRHSWIYKKRCASNFAQAKYAPMKEHEDVLVFANSTPHYFPIKEKRQGSGKERAKYAYSDKSRHASGEFVGKIKGDYDKINDAGNEELRYPSSVQEFNNRAIGDRGLHPTQKPIALGEYLIRTYSVAEQLVVDNACGSGTFCKAAQNLGRRYIGIDISSDYCSIARKRLEAVETGVPVREQNKGQMPMFPVGSDG